MDSNLPDLIRCAVASGELDKAHLLWDGYARELGDQLDKRSLPESSLREAEALVEWARQMVLAQKAHLQDGLNNFVKSVRIEQAYDTPCPASRRGFRSFLL
jgi:hypothetical protein